MGPAKIPSPIKLQSQIPPNIDLYHQIPPHHPATVPPPFSQYFTPPQSLPTRGVRPDLLSPLLHYDQPALPDVISSRDDVIIGGADDTRDDNDVTSRLDDTVLFAKMEEISFAPSQVRL